MGGKSFPWRGSRPGWSFPGEKFSGWDLSERGISIYYKKIIDLSSNRLLTGWPNPAGHFIYIFTLFLGNCAHPYLNFISDNPLDTS